MQTIDESLRKFENYKSSIEQYIEKDLSEADTRSKLIDVLLLQVLGWSETDLAREGHVDSGYYDYKITLPGFFFLLEAKKQFSNLSLPSGHKTASFKILHKDNREVIDQIRGYSIDSGVQYGLITNGKQFIVGKLFNIDSKNWKENQCLIFNGVEDITKRFLEFYENLSKFSVITNGGFKFLNTSNQSSYKTILSTLINRDKEQIRNTLSAKLSPIITSIFGEIFSEEKEDDLEFINYCFVQNEEVKKNRNEIQKLFTDTSPKLAEVIPAHSFSSITSQIKNEIKVDNLKSQSPPKPIIIIGSKGAGKTTFLNYIFKYKFASDDIPNHLSLYIDLRKYFDREKYFEAENICRDITELLFEKYESLNLHSLTTLKRVFYKEIQRNNESIWLHYKQSDDKIYNEKLAEFLIDQQKNKELYFEKLSKYLIRERRKRLIIIIDNADQFDSTIQEKVFLFSHSLSKISFCSAVISLREGYYYKWRSAPPFDAYESNVYHISAPKYSDILQKRIDFALEKTALNGHTVGQIDSGHKIDMPNQSIYEFLHGLRHSLFSETNSNLVDFLSFTTFPNIREGLRIFNSFLTSGHTKVSEYIIQERFRQNNQHFHSIPLHEFIKSIGLQNKLYYHSDISIIHNLFTPAQDSDSHFLKCYILIYLQRKHDQIGESKLVAFDELNEIFNNAGFKINAILATISLLLKYNFIDSDEQITDVQWQSLPAIQNICLTAKGYYYVKELITRFHYLDLVVQDTPIFEKESFDKIKSVFPKQGLSKYKLTEARIATVTEFIKYLKKREVNISPYLYSLFGTVCELIESSLENEIKEIRKSINLYS